MNVREALERQYRASLEMLERAVVQCPDSLWAAGTPNKFWHIAYHALFYVHFYLQKSDKDFMPWTGHRPDSQYLGPRPWAPEAPPKAVAPYSKDEVLEFQRFCRAELAARLPQLDMDAPSGFGWLPFSTLEVQLYSLRHLAHHTGQLIERLRSQGSIGVSWVIGRERPGE